MRFAAKNLTYLCSPKEKNKYHTGVKGKHGMDKAGGYGIQETGSLLVNRIEGCFYNVMGLPVNTLQHLLSKFQIDLWDNFS